MRHGLELLLINDEAVDWSLRPGASTKAGGTYYPHVCICIMGNFLNEKGKYDCPSAVYLPRKNIASPDN